MTAFTAGSAATITRLVQAQAAWPVKPVKLVVPFAPGGATDVVARLWAQRVSQLWGQSVLVDNRPGAGGNLGADAVAKSAPDGYTLLMASGSITINPSLYAKMPFDTRRDLMPISNVAQGPMLVLVKDGSPYRTLSDLVGAAKARPGALNFGSAGVGTQTHLAAELLASAAGIDLQHVPYKGEGPALTDLMGGQVELVVSNFAGGSALVAPGKLRALAVTAGTRSPNMPNLPTVAEAGVGGYEASGWFGLLAPTGTPAEVVSKVYRDTTTVLADQAIKDRLFALGMSAVASAPKDFARQMDTELARWSDVVKARKISTR
jgi:tripartite-type tricarboxylate transporter receptor subunit TctC